MSTAKKCEVGWSGITATILLALTGLYVLQLVVKKILLQRKLKRWKNTQKDVVILHGFPPAKTMPNLSPFVLKVETYLRLANLRYTWDKKDYFGPKGKCPWISINGKHIGDSEFIIEYLGRKFEKNFSAKSTESQLAIARVTRTMLEEYFTCVIGLERMVYGDIKVFQNLANIPFVMFYYMKYVMTGRYWDQGIGRHTQEEVTQIMTANLKAVSKILGAMKYFGGDEICEDDCGIFAVIAQCVWGLPNTQYEKLINGECSNLKDYCIRMKEKLWADWDHCLAK